MIFIPKTFSSSNKIFYQDIRLNFCSKQHKNQDNVHENL